MPDILATFTYAIFEKSDKSFQVLQYKDESSGGRFVAVGHDLSTKKNLLVHLYGDWVTNPKDGKRNFKVEYSDIARQDDLDGITAYLTSLKCGIGKMKAEKIYDHFKDRTWDILRDDPWKISEVDGIGASLSDKVADAVQKSFSLRRIMMLFSDVHAKVSPQQVQRFIKDNPVSPYEALCTDPFLGVKSGISFDSCDAISEKMGLSPLAPSRIRAYISKLLGEAAIKGHVCLPAKDILLAFQNDLALSREEGLQALKDAWKRNYLRSIDKMIYSIRSYDEEGSIIRNVKRLNDTEDPFRNSGIDKFLADYQKETGIELAPQQRDAVETALNNAVSVITGGPGTGKTTVINALLYVHKRIYTYASPVLLAPTGRAARRMSDATGYPAQTIHSAVGFKGEDIPVTDDEIDGNLIVIDEASMMDQFITSVLFDKVKDSAKVVLVGDPDQLPSVGAGNVLADFIASGVIPTTKLSVIFRQAGDNPIIQNAALINQGKTELVYGKTFKFFEENTETNLLYMASDFYVRCAKAYGLDNIILLNPQRNNTDLSVDAFNKELQSRLNPSTGLTKDIQIAHNVFRIGDRVMQSKNTEIAKNGDTGYIKDIRHRPSKDDPDVWLYEVDIEFNGDGIIHTYNMDDMKNIELAYCCTVHKSQGQEYDTVIEIVSSHHRSMLKRNLIYTGITRAKKNVAIIGDRNAVESSIENDTAEVRFTNLAKRLKKAV